MGIHSTIVWFNRGWGGRDVNVVGRGENRYVDVTLYSGAFANRASTSFALPSCETRVQHVLRIFPAMLPPTGCMKSSSTRFGKAISCRMLCVNNSNRLCYIPLSSRCDFDMPFSGSTRGSTSGVFTLYSMDTRGMDAHMDTPEHLDVHAHLHRGIQVYNDMSDIYRSRKKISTSDVFAERRDVPALTNRYMDSSVIDLDCATPLTDRSAHII